MKRIVLSFAVLLGLGNSVYAHGDEFSFGVPADAAKATRTVPIAMRDLTFDPAFVAVKTGETVRFVITNTSTADHDFTLGDAKAQDAHRKEMAEMALMGDMAMVHDNMHGHDSNAVFIKAGQTKALTWTFTKAAKIEFACNVPGHYEAGMKGKMVVR